MSYIVGRIYKKLVIGVVFGRENGWFGFRVGRFIFYFFVAFVFF